MAISILHFLGNTTGRSSNSFFWNMVLSGFHQPFVDGFHWVDPSHLSKHGASHDDMMTVHRQNGDTELVRWRDIQACPSYSWPNIINAPRSIRHFAFKLSSDFEKQPQVKPHNWSSIATAMTIAIGAPLRLCWVLKSLRIERGKQSMPIVPWRCVHMAHGIPC